MDCNSFDKPLKPRWLGIDIKGNGLWVCPVCSRVIKDKTDVCPSCEQKFTYEGGRRE
jgi:rubrerythrin